jgi:hypothetical protein
MCSSRPLALRSKNGSDQTRYTYDAIRDIYVVVPSTPNIDPPPDFSILFRQPHTHFTIYGFTAVNMPQQSTTHSYVIEEAPSSAAGPSLSTKEIPKNASTQLKNTRKRKAAPPEFDPVAHSFFSQPPLRQLAPKPTPSTSKPGRRDSVIEIDEKFIQFNPISRPISRTVPAKSRPTKPKTNTNATTLDDQDEPLVPPLPLQDKSQPLSTHKRTKVNAANREYEDHRRGLHGGRDPYGLASMPCLNAELPLPWGRCEECEKEKKMYTET